MFINNIFDLKDILLNENHTIVIYKNDASVHTSNDRGVAPLMKLLKEDNTQLKDAMIADKVIGKAAALLMVYAKVKEVYTPTISTPALQVFKNNNIEIISERNVACHIPSHKPNNLTLGECRFAQGLAQW